MGQHHSHTQGLSSGTDGDPVATEELDIGTIELPDDCPWQEPQWVDTWDCNERTQ